MSVTVTELGRNSTASNVNAIAATCGAGTSAGDVVIVAVAMDDPTSLTAGMMADDRGNSYSLVLDQFRWHVSSERGAIYCVKPTTQLVTSDHITWTPNTGTGMGLIAVKASGLTNATVDANNSDANLSTATPDTGTSGLLGQADELAIAQFCWRGTATVSSGPGAGWSQIGATMTFGSPQENMAIFYAETAATTAINPSITLSAISDSGGQIATWKVSAVAAAHSLIYKPARAGSWQAF